MEIVWINSCSTQTKLVKERMAAVGASGIFSVAGLPAQTVRAKNLRARSAPLGDSTMFNRRRLVYEILRDLKD